MGLQETRGDVKLQVEEWDAMDGDLSLQKLQLTLPDQFEDCEELDQDGKAMEVWPTVERLTRSPAVRLRCMGWCKVRMRNGERINLWWTSYGLLC